MKIVINTILAIAFFAAALQAAWSIINTILKPTGTQAAIAPTLEKPEPIPFGEAYQRYVDKELHSKYADRLPLEAERVERHLKIIKEQLEAQQRIIEEARRP